MGDLATNAAGEVLTLEGGKWVPAQTATNQAGGIVAFDGEAWVPVEVPAPDKPSAAAAAAARSAVTPPDQSFTASLLPGRVDAQGNVVFDPNVGLLGFMKRALMAPGDALKGEFAPFSAEGAKRVPETAMAFTPMGVASRVGMAMTPIRGRLPRETRKAVPTREELATATKAGYDESAALGVEFTAKSVKDLADDIALSLEKEFRIAENNPQTFALLDKLRNPPEGASSVALQNLDNFRKSLGNVAGSPDKGVAAAASIAIRRIDDFLEAHVPENVVGGTAAAQAGPALVRAEEAGAAAAQSRAQKAAALQKEARGNYAAGARSDKITNLEEAAELRAAAANSGQNIGNTIRSRLASLALNPKQMRGFSKEEAAAIRSVAKGSKAQNALRIVSNLFGGGLGLGSTFLAALGGIGGAATGNVPLAAMAALPLMGAGTRKAYNAMMQRALKAIDETVRARSPLYEKQAAQGRPGYIPQNPQRQAQSPAAKNLMARLLMTSGLAAAGPPGNLMARPYEGVP